MNTRKSLGLQVADISRGYVCYVYPEALIEPFYLYGEDWNTVFSPIEFR